MTRTSKPAPASAPSPNAHAQSLEHLERVLGALLAEHKSLVELTAEHRRAISEADIKSLRACMERQGELVTGIVKLERERQAVVATLMSLSPVPVTPGVPTTITSLAAKAPEAVRTRLARAAQALREVLTLLHAENAALKAAAATLSTHMEGIMRQVCRTLSHAGTYARTGAVDSTVQVVSAIDLKS